MMAACDCDVVPVRSSGALDLVYHRYRAEITADFDVGRRRTNVRVRGVRRQAQDVNWTAFGAPRFGLLKNASVFTVVFFLDVFIALLASRRIRSPPRQSFSDLGARFCYRSFGLLDLIHGEYDAKDSASSQSEARGRPMAPLLIRGRASLLGFAPTAT